MPTKEEALESYYKAVQQHELTLETLKEEREVLKQVNREFNKSERDLKAMQTIGQNIGEILQEITTEKYIVKTSHGPRYVVGCAKDIDRSKLKLGTRVSLDVVTLTIMKILSREVDPTIFAMTEATKTYGLDFSSIGGLEDQIREIREVIELPIKNPEIFKRIGIQPPKGVLLYGPPGTGKTLLAKIVASTMDVTFIKVVASSLIEKYIGESAKMVREMFAYARLKAPCIIFLDEIDAIGGARTNESNSSDREVQRTLMELLNQLDGFSDLDGVKVIMATNRPDILDSALLRPGRLDRKIEIPLPNEHGRKEILKIHSKNMNQDQIDLDTIVKMSSGFNGADLRNVCTEAGMIALRDDRDYVINDDFIKSVRKISENKKLETKLDYKKR
ncbi:19S-PA700 proteasome regulatory particle subunit Rpt4p-S10b [Enterocytozoon bieneusi H348]|nr:19S-PA700 proteasome regulatory particle subunit Rpt4p-S10b [Enterocytozoon bieneusi H348]|eukprot:XP_001828080.1 19S-PA700 proteasome regulatory particle subunit Rpt4p-S10b [Enterocytozoon bieneusi H348]